MTLLGRKMILHLSRPLPVQLRCGGAGAPTLYRCSWCTLLLLHHKGHCHNAYGRCTCCFVPTVIAGIDGKAPHFAAGTVAASAKAEITDVAPVLAKTAVVIPVACVFAATTAADPTPPFQNQKIVATVPLCSHTSARDTDKNRYFDKILLPLFSV